ncbi:hypothetical protein GCM10023330_28800 [Litoribaculum gwangyangense]|uniref:Uncharacterized protein n=1 Tax=Litoribaculum gwangyangense TaxID=1130722 RepID=A0ABP9CSV5_9FLAO
MSIPGVSQSNSFITICEIANWLSKKIAKTSRFFFIKMIYANVHLLFESLKISNNIKNINNGLIGLFR